MAISYLKKTYKDVVIKVAGNNIIETIELSDLIAQTEYFDDNPLIVNIIGVSWTGHYNTNYLCNNLSFVWSSGTLNQISYGNGIIPPSNYNLSDILQLKIIRDTTNTSGLFIGTDPNNSICRISSIDIHIECDDLGSNTQFTK